MVIRMALNTWPLLTFFCKFGWLKHVLLLGVRTLDKLLAHLTSVKIANCWSHVWEALQFGKPKLCPQVCSEAAKLSHFHLTKWQLEISWSTIPYLTSKEELYKMKLSFKRRDDLQNGVYKTGWLNPPTLTKRWISIWFCARPHPFCGGNRKGMHNSVAGWPGLDKFRRVQANKGMQPKRAKGSTGRLR